MNIDPKEVTIRIQERKSLVDDWRQLGNRWQMKTRDKWILLIFGSARSFGEVAALIDFATGLVGYDCRFVALDRPAPEAEVIASAGFKVQSLYNIDGSINRATVTDIIDDPPSLAIAADYSQFNVRRHQLPMIRSGISILEHLRRDRGVPCAVMDIVGLSFQCTVPLQSPFCARLVPVTGYRPVYRASTGVSRDLVFVRSTARAAPRLGSYEGALDPSRRTVLVTMPHRSLGELSGWFARTWVRQVERALALVPAVNIVGLESVTSLFSPSVPTVSIPQTSSVATMNRWAAEADLVVTSNWSSYLAARAAHCGARILVTFNDRAQSRRVRPEFEEGTPRWPRGRSVRLIPSHAFDQWLPRIIPQFWPGVRVDTADVLWNASAVPLFQPERIARAASLAAQPVPALPSTKTPAEAIESIANAGA